MKRRNITITEQLDRLLVDESIRSGLSVSDIIRRAVEEYLQRQQDDGKRQQAADGPQGGSVNEEQPRFVFEKIEDLLRDNVIVKSILTTHRSGLISREEALIWMVLSLADQNADMEQRINRRQGRKGER